MATRKVTLTFLVDDNMTGVLAYLVKDSDDDGMIVITDSSGQDYEIAVSGSEMKIEDA